MTPAEVVEALCEARGRETELRAMLPAMHDAHLRALARRDAIRDRLEAYITACHDELCPCERPAQVPCDSAVCMAWRKLEEACRGK